MNAKSIFLGFLAGVVLTVAGLFAIRQTAAIDETSPNGADPIQYLSQPESYEGKEETSVKVLAPKVLLSKTPVIVVQLSPSLSLASRVQVVGVCPNWLLEVRI